MESGKHANALLVEILIAVFFFLIAATIIVRVFAAGHLLTSRADAQTRAMARVQNIADALYLAENEEERTSLLKDSSFVNSHGTWTLREEDYSVLVTGTVRSTQAGQLWEGEVSAFLNPSDPGSLEATSEELIRIPCVSFTEVRG